MSQDFLSFEKPIEELREKLEGLRMLSDQSDVDLVEEVQKIEVKLSKMTTRIFADLDDWQIAQLARHPQRPYTRDYIHKIIHDFYELHGDRQFGDDPALICGLGRLDGMPIAIIGHQKGRDTAEKIRHNFGMPHPEGYRKAIRVMRLAEKFNIPIVTFIDTPGAYPGIQAEERGQSEAIAVNLQEMSVLKTPIITVVIGEGGSGGALAIGVCDHLCMLQYATYSVISPEGCASILWRDAEKAADAAKAMKITASHLQTIGIVDEIIAEPQGGAHRDHEVTAQTVRRSVIDQLKQLNALDPQTLVNRRFDRWMQLGINLP